MPCVQIKLQAINPAYNVSRYYELDLTQDLFGDWVIITYYGRINLKGQRKQYGYQSFNEMCRKLYEILRKRFHAQSRIGCNYSLVTFCATEKLDNIKTLVEHARTKKRTTKGKADLILEKTRSLKQEEICCHQIKKISFDQPLNIAKHKVCNPQI